MDVKKKELIKEILTLGDKLDSAVGVEILMVLDEMEAVIDEYTESIDQKYLIRSEIC